ncbi:MAG TPA: metalloregulator ArsR/SmtB family transcription factor [Myxococcaceae bacterium]|nr:metalloregulator ArsR/SmtB family transcription factor [Myxococcaceae bacterium]
MLALSQSFRALGDPTRLRILRLLAEAPLNVSELVSLVGLAQPSISHHLSRLRRLGLVREERQASFTYYSLALDPTDARWPLIALAREEDDAKGDRARLKDLLREREDRQALNEKLLEPGQSWFLWASALASLLPPLEVADFGCGSGTLSVEIARWAKRVIAIDQNRVALDQARQRAEAEGLENIRFLRQDLQRLTLPDAQLDLVVVSQSLHHMQDPRAVLGEAFRILKPGGRLIVLELMPHAETWVQDRLGHRHLGFEPGELEKVLGALGFVRVVRVTHDRLGGSPFRVFMLNGEKKV